MLALPAHVPTTYKTYSQLTKEIRERAKSYPNPKLFSGMKLATNVEGMIDVSETDHKRYMKALTLYRNLKGF